MARRIADLVIKIGADSYEFTQNINKLNSSLGKFSNDLGKLGNDLSLKVTAPLAAFAAMSVKAFADSEKAVAKVGQAIKQTGNAAGFSLQDLQKEAAKLQGSTLFEDDQILNDVTAQLLSFPKIVGANFLLAQKAALDLSTLLDGDVKGAALQLGKALQDPISGLTALRKSGVSFSTDQRNLIKNLVEQNQLFEAQKIILEEVNRQYGGQAEAQAKVGMGPVIQLKNAWGDFMEQIGGAIMPMLQKLADMLKELSITLQGIPKPVLEVSVAFAALIAGLGPALILISKLKKIIPLLSAELVAGLVSLGPYVAALAALVALYAKYNNDKEKDTVGRKKFWTDEYDDIKHSDADIQKLIKETEARLNVIDQMRKAMGTKSSQPDTEEQTDLKNKLEALKEIVQARKEAVLETKKGNGADTESIGLITQLETKISELEKKKKDATSVNQIININNQLDILSDKLKELKEAGKNRTDYSQNGDFISGLPGYVMSLEDLNNKLNGKLPEPKADPIVRYINGVEKESRAAFENLQKTIELMQDSLKTAFGSAISSFTSSIGQFAAGDFGIEGMLAGILNIMGSFLTTLGSQLIEMSIIMISFKKAMSWLIANPMLALAIGVGMVATGAFMQSMAAKVSAPKLANGGLAYGPTYAMVGDNINAGVDPEVIAPLSKLKNMLGGNRQSVNLSGEFIVRGSDLVYVLDRTNQSFNRRR